MKFSLWKVALCLFVSIFILSVGLSLADDYVEEDTRYIYDMDQVVEGEGYANFRQVMATSRLNLKNVGHGSGNYSTEMILKSRQKCLVKNYTTDDWKKTNDYSITLDESAQMVYGMADLNLPGSFRSGPLESKWREDTCTKNYAGGVVMNALFDDGNRIDKDLHAGLFYERKTSDEYWESKVDESYNSTMDVEADFEGMAHVGALIIEPVAHPKAPVNEKALVNEDYRGSFSLVKRMSVEGYNNTHHVHESWLPCCTGGWADVAKQDRKGHAADGIFDCTCYVPPGTAQFPRIY